MVLVVVHASKAIADRALRSGNQGGSYSLKHSHNYCIACLDSGCITSSMMLLFAYLSRIFCIMYLALVWEPRVNGLKELCLDPLCVVPWFPGYKAVWGLVRLCKVPWLSARFWQIRGTHCSLRFSYSLCLPWSCILRYCGASFHSWNTRDAEHHRGL
jgi:hypothetical protein